MDGAEDLLVVKEELHMQEGILICEHLTLGYEGNEILSDINFSLKAGSYLLVVGENGSGKSTLMKGILGLLRPKSGACHFHGLRKDEVGYLPQQTAMQKEFPASVFEVVLSGCLNRHGRLPFYTKKDRRRAEKMLAKMEIEDLRNEAFANLSGGQKQRVLLCRAMLATTKLLVLDEPVAGLDPMVTGQMYELIQSVNKEEKVTIIMITHDLAGSLDYADCVLHMGAHPEFFESTEEYKKTSLYRNLMGGGVSD